MGIFKYRIESTNIDNRDVDAPDGWKDDESIFPRSDTYNGIFRKFSANSLTFKGTGADLLRTIFAQTSFESEAEFVVYEKDLDTYKWFERFRGSFDFITYNDINGNEGRSVEINVNDSSFWNKIKNRESIKPQLSQLNSLDGLQISGFTNEEVFIKLPEVPKELEAYITTEVNSSSVLEGEHSMPLSVIYKEDSGAKDVTDTSGTSSLDNAFYQILENVNELSLRIVIETTYKFTDDNTEFEILLKQYRSNSLHDSRQLISKSGDNNDEVLVNIIKNESYTDVQLNDYFILCVERIGVRDEFKNVIPYLASVEINAQTSVLSEAEISGMPIHEVLSRNLQLISNTDVPLYSELLGRVDSEPRSYASNGDLSLLLVTNGKRIRQFAREEAPITAGFKDIFTSLNAIMPIGVCIEKIGGIDNIRLEKLRYFFDDRIVLTIDNASNIKQSIIENKIINKISVGYQKAEYEQKNGLFEYNQKSEFSTPISVINNEYSVNSVFRADDQAIGNARDKAKSIAPTEDTRYDTDNFFITLIKNENQLLNGNFDNWVDDNNPNDWTLLGISVVLRKYILNSDRCLFVSGFAGVTQISQDIIFSSIKKVNIKFSFENIGTSTFNPAYSVKLISGPNIYYLQGDGSWLLTTTETFIYFYPNLNPTPELELQSFKSYSILTNDLPEIGTITFKLIGLSGFITDNIYIGDSQYTAKTDEDFTLIDNAINGDKSFNLDITPARNLYNHGSIIRAGLENNLNKFIRFNTSDKNSTLITKKIGELFSIAENEDIQIDKLDEPFYKPIQWEFELPIDKNVIDILNETFVGETKQKYLGIVKWKMNTNDEYKYIWIQDMQTGGQSGKGTITGIEINSNYIIPVSTLRSIISRNVDILNDVYGNDASLLSPVSYFNGEDGFVYSDKAVLDTPINNGKYKMSIYAKVMFNNEVVNNDSIVGAGYSSTAMRGGVGIVRYLNGIIYVTTETNDGTDYDINTGMSDLNTVYEVIGTLDVTQGVLKAYINGTYIGEKTGMSTNIADYQYSNRFCIGAGNGLRDFYDGNVCDVKMWDEIVTPETMNSITPIATIPLPHLGYGFDANGDEIALTVNNVTEDYTIGGSKWLIEKGAVAVDAVELISNGDFSDGGNNWTTTGVISNGSCRLQSPSQQLYQPVNVVNGKTYRLFYEIISGTGLLYASSTGFGSSTQAIPATQGKHFVDILCVNDAYPLKLVAATTGSDIIIDNISVKLAYPQIKPNKPDSTPISLGANDILIPPTNFLNTSPFMVDFLDTEVGDISTDFFDKSDITIWKDEIRNSQWYNASEPYQWHSSELNTDYIEANIREEYKNRFYPMIKDEIYEYLNLYNTAYVYNKSI